MARMPQTQTGFDRIIKLLKDQESSHWIIGDAISTYQLTPAMWDMLSERLEQEGISHTAGTLRAYARVAGSIPAESRIQGVSFAAHQAALSLGSPQRSMKLLEDMISDGVKPTRDRVLDRVRTAKGKQDQSTANAAAAWRDLRAAVAKMEQVDPAVLDSFLLLQSSSKAKQAMDLQDSLLSVHSVLGGSLARVKNTLQAKKAVAPKGTDAPKAAAPKVKVGKKAAAPKVKVGKLGRGRGI